MERAYGQPVVAGAAIAAVHAGDLITLFIWWEATAITSVFLILAAGTTGQRAAMRYLLFQVSAAFCCWQARQSLPAIAARSALAGWLLTGRMRRACG